MRHASLLAVLLFASVLGLTLPAKGGKLMGSTVFTLTPGEEKGHITMTFGDWEEDVKATPVNVKCDQKAALWQFAVSAVSFGELKFNSRTAFIDTSAPIITAPFDDFRAIQKQLCSKENCEGPKGRKTFACKEVPKDLPSLELNVRGQMLVLQPEDFIEASDGTCRLLIEGSTKTEAWALGQPFLETFELRFDTEGRSVQARLDAKKRRKGSGLDLLFLILAFVWLIEFSIHYPYISLPILLICCGFCGYAYYKKQQEKEKEEKEKMEQMSQPLVPEATKA